MIGSISPADREVKIFFGIIFNNVSAKSTWVVATSVASSGNAIFKDRQGSGAQIEQDRFHTHSSQRFRITDGHCAADQGAEYQRDHQHLHQADKTISQYIENTVDQNRISEVPFRHIIMDQYTTYRTG